MIGREITDVRDDINDESTIEGTIEKGKNIILSFKNFSILDRLDIMDGSFKIDIPIDNVVYDYLPELKRAVQKVELTDDEMLKYIYRPDLLSYDLYGTTTYEFLLLALNSIISPKYFTKKMLYVINPEYLEDVMTDIYNAEQEYLTFNRANYDVSDSIDDGL